MIAPSKKRKKEKKKRIVQYARVHCRLFLSAPADSRIDEGMQAGVTEGYSASVQVQCIAMQLETPRPHRTARFGSRPWTVVDAQPLVDCRRSH